MIPDGPSTAWDVDAAPVTADAVKADREKIDVITAVVIATAVAAGDTTATPPADDLLS